MNISLEVDKAVLDKYYDVLISIGFYHSKEEAETAEQDKEMFWYLDLGDYRADAVYYCIPDNEYDLYSLEIYTEVGDGEFVVEDFIKELDKEAEEAFLFNLDLFV